jgi:hypothetical protein
MASNLRPFRPFCRQNGISVARGYELLNAGLLKAVKVGSRTYIREEDGEAFLASLPSYQPRTAGERFYMLRFKDEVAARLKAAEAAPALQSSEPAAHLVVLRRVGTHAYRIEEYVRPIVSRKHSQETTGQQSPSTMTIEATGKLDRLTPGGKTRSASGK